jgi:hypothetical protein
MQLLYFVREDGGSCKEEREGGECVAEEDVHIGWNVTIVI